MGKNGFLPSGGQADPSLLVQTGMQACPSPSERPNPALRTTPLLAYCLWSWLFCPLLCDGPASFREESPPVVQELAVHWLIDYSPSMGGGRSLYQEGPDSSFPLLLLFGCHIKGYRVFWGPGNQLCSVNGNLCPRTDHCTGFAYVQFDAPLFELVFFFFLCVCVGDIDTGHGIQVCQGTLLTVCCPSGPVKQMCSPASQSLPSLIAGVGSSFWWRVLYLSLLTFIGFPQAHHLQLGGSPLHCWHLRSMPHANVKLSKRSAAEHKA